MVGHQLARDGLAYVADAEPKQQPRERARLRRLEACEQVVDLLLAEPVDGFQFFPALAKTVEVGQVGHQSLVHQRDRSLLAEPVHVHRPARDVVLDGPLELAGAPAGDVAEVGLAVAALDGLAAHGAHRRRLIHRQVAVRVYGNRPNDGRDHVARSLYRHVVADADVAAGDVVGVVERRLRNGHPADVDRL